MSPTHPLSFFGVDVSSNRHRTAIEVRTRTLSSRKAALSIEQFFGHDLAQKFRRNWRRAGADHERLTQNRCLGQRRNITEAKRSGHGGSIGGRRKRGHRRSKCRDIRRYNKIRPTLDCGSGSSRRDRQKTSASGCQNRSLCIEPTRRQRRTRNAPKRDRH